MANKLQPVKIVLPSLDVYHFRAYVDNARRWEKDVFSIEGVEMTYVSNVSKSEMSIYVDPRYSLLDVIDEVEALLLEGPPKRTQGDIRKRIWLKIKNFNIKS